MAEPAKMSLLTLYRQLLKKLPRYPSIKRFQLLQATKEEFRANQRLSDKEAARKERIKAEIGLKNVNYYISKLNQGRV